MSSRFVPIGGSIPGFGNTGSQQRFQPLAGAPTTNASPAVNPPAPGPLAGSTMDYSGPAVGNVSAMSMPSLPGAQFGIGANGLFGSIGLGGFGPNATFGERGDGPSVQASLSPFGGLGLSAQTGQGPAVDQAANMGGKAALNAAGVPTSINLLSQLSPMLSHLVAPFATPFSMINSINSMAVQNPNTVAGMVNAIQNDPQLNMAGPRANQAVLGNFLSGVAPMTGGPQPIGNLSIEGVPFDNPVTNVNASTQAGPTVAAQSLGDMFSGGIFGGPASTRGDTGGVSLSDAGRGVDSTLEMETGTGITGPTAGVAGPGATAQGGVVGSVGVGQANDAATSAAAAAGVSVSDAAGGGGSGGGDGGCYLGTWSLGGLTNKRERKKYTVAFARFKSMFLKKHPEHGPALFAMYQRAARTLLQHVSTRPALAEQVRQHLLEALVKKVHAHMSKRELDHAVTTLITTVRQLAHQLGVPLPGGGSRFVPLHMATGGNVTGRDVTSASSPSPMTAADRARSARLLTDRSVAPGDKTGFVPYDSNQRPTPWPYSYDMNRPR